MFRRPYFSIIIPTLNEERFLPLLLGDLKRQTFTNFEIIVVDGNSEDETVTLAKRFPKTSVLISHKRNAGYQRNIGAARAGGKYLIFNDADVRLPQYFLDGIKYRLSEKKADTFTCWAGPESEKSKDDAFFAISNLGLESSKFLNSPIAYGAMIGCERSIFPKIGGFDETITYGEDAEFVSRATKKGYSFFVFRDPQFHYSLRRYKNSGILPVIRAHLKYLASVIINEYPTNKIPYYPMEGGKSYQNADGSSLKGILSKITQDVHKIKKQKKIEKFLEELLS